MKQSIKKIAYYSGIFRLSNWLNKHHISILMYHGFSQSIKNKNLKNIEGKHQDIEEFEKHLKLISKYCTPIPLEMVLSVKQLPPNPIVITFDDGYKNNYTYAFPLLKKYNIPVTIFVTTGFIDRTNYLWTDRLEYIIYNAPLNNITFSWGEQKIFLELSTIIEKKKTIRSLKKFLKALPPSKKQAFIDELQTLLKIDYDWDKISPDLLPLTWDDIREMKASGLVSIGSHTVTHPILSKCTAEEQRKELAICQQRIVAELDEKCHLFAYPNGQATDYNQQTIRILKELGYSGAVSTIVGYVHNNNNNNKRDNFQLNRFGTGVDRYDLGMTITGFSRLLGTS